MLATLQEGFQLYLQKDGEPLTHITLHHLEGGLRFTANPYCTAYESRYLLTADQLLAFYCTHVNVACLPLSPHCTPYDYLFVAEGHCKGKSLALLHEEEGWAPLTSPSTSPLTSPTTSPAASPATSPALPISIPPPPSYLHLLKDHLRLFVQEGSAPPMRVILCIKRATGGQVFVNGESAEWCARYEIAPRQWLDASALLTSYRRYFNLIADTHPFECIFVAGGEYKGQSLNTLFQSLDMYELYQINDE